MKKLVSIVLSLICILSVATASAGRTESLDFRAYASLENKTVKQWMATEESRAKVAASLFFEMSTKLSDVMPEGSYYDVEKCVVGQINKDAILVIVPDTENNFMAVCVFEPQFKGTYNAYCFIEDNTGWKDPAWKLAKENCGDNVYTVNRELFSNATVEVILAILEEDDPVRPQ